MALIRSKAPLRLGLAGGGTDISSYSDVHGGAVLNATIAYFAHCIIEPANEGKIIFSAADLHTVIELESKAVLDLDGELKLHKGVYNRIISEFNAGEPLSFSMTTYSDVPAGSGLGSSSTMVVAMIKAYVELLNLPLDDYSIAQLAYDIERIDLALSGGKQDQYAATFGGFNYIEFLQDGNVIVNPLRIKNWALNELESSMILYYTGVSRESAHIIDEQIANTKNNLPSTLESMDLLKHSAYEMKTCLLKSDFEGFAQCIRDGWSAKKGTTPYVSNSHIDELYAFILEHGGKAAKISGAGGGGYFVVICNPVDRYRLIEELNSYSHSGYASAVRFYERGAQAWTIF